MIQLGTRNVLLYNQYFAKNKHNSLFILLFIQVSFLLLMPVLLFIIYSCMYQDSAKRPSYKFIYIFLLYFF